MMKEKERRRTMEATMMTKICATIGLLGGIVASWFGGWDGAMSTLIICMGIDFVSGLIVAGVFNNSPKTENGALESRASWKGLARKCMTLLFVLVAVRLDMIFDTNYIRDSVIIGYIASEVVSIVENAGLMGVPIPDKIVKAIEILKDRQEKE